MQGLGTQEDIPKAFHALEQAYQLLPDGNLWHMITVVMVNDYSLKTSIPYASPVYHKQLYDKDLSSNEDYIHSRLKYLKCIYQLDFKHVDGIGGIYAWPRATLSIVLGETIGENSLFKERYFTKKAIQGYYLTITALSHYYKGEKQDIPLRSYGVNMPLK